MLMSKAHSPKQTLPRSTFFHTLMDEGRLYVAANATPGTGLGQNVSASFAATAALLNIRNQESEDFLYPLLIKLWLTVVPASATRADIVVKTDTGAARGSGGTVLVTHNPNQASANILVPNTIRFGGVAASAETSLVRQVGREVLRTDIPKVGDCYVLAFGQGGMEAAQTMAGTDAGGMRRIYGLPPCEIPPGSDMFLHAWYASNAATGASYETEIWLAKA